MYYYLVDPRQFEGKNFEFYHSHLLSLLGQYQIAGETARVTKLRTIEDLVDTALSHGAGTLVVVGGDQTFSKALTACLGKPLTLGYIPLSQGSELKEILGIGDLADAVLRIAKRRVETLDVAKIGSAYFISSIYFGANRYVDPASPYTAPGLLAAVRQALKTETLDVEMLVDGAYTVRNALLASSVVNARNNRSLAGSRSSVGNPKDGLLDVVIASKLGRLQFLRQREWLEKRFYEVLPGASVIHARKVKIKGPEGTPVYLAGEVIARLPASVEMSSEKIRVIVGRDRQF